MTTSLIVACIVATPPTLAATLAFLVARASDRSAAHERAAIVAQSLDTLQATVTRIESAVIRVEAGVVELRERIASRAPKPLTPSPVHSPHPWDEMAASADAGHAGG